MKNHIICHKRFEALRTLIFLFAFTTTIHAQVAVQWINEYDNFSGPDIIREMAVDDSGNVYVTGSSWDGSIQEENYVTIKYNTHGVQQWRKEYDNFSGPDIARAIAVDTAGNVYVTGSSWDGSVSDLNYVTIKYSPTGVQLWLREYDNFSDNDAALDLVLDSAANVYVTGASWDGSITETNYVTIKYNTAGTQQWLREYDNFSGPDTARALAVDRSGNVYVTGSSWAGSVMDHDYTTIKYSPAGTQLWVRHYDSFSDNDFARAMVLDDSGNVYVTGSSYDGSVLEENYVTIKYDTAGTQVWIAEYDNFAGPDIAYAIAIDDAECIYVTGSSWDGAVLNDNYVTIKYSTSGAQVWIAEYDNFADNDRAYAIALDSSANVIITGSSWDGGVLEENYVTIKYDSSGAQQWLAEYDNFAGPDIARTVKVDRFGSVYVAGSSWAGSIQEENYVTIKYCVQPSVSVGADTLAMCYGDSVQLTVSGGVSCSWLPSAGLSNDSSYSPMASPSSSRLYVVTVMNAGGCTRSDSVYVIVRSTYAVTEQAWICAGETYTFPDSATSDTAVVHISNFSTVYGCDSLVYTFLQVDSIAPDTSVTMTGATLTSGASGVFYQWIDCNNGNQPIAGATSQSYFPTVNGNYAVIVSGPGCSDTSACINVTSVSANQPAIQQSQILIYPNPGGGVLNIDFGVATQNVSVCITDLSGKEIFLRNGQDVKTLTLDLSTLSSGVYMIVIVADGVTRVEKLVRP